MQSHQHRGFQYNDETDLPPNQIYTGKATSFIYLVGPQVIIPCDIPLEYPVQCLPTMHVHSTFSWLILMDLPKSNCVILLIFVITVRCEWSDISEYRIELHYMTNPHKLIIWCFSTNMLLTPVLAGYASCLPSCLWVNHFLCKLLCSNRKGTDETNYKHLFTPFFCKHQLRQVLFVFKFLKVGRKTSVKFDEQRIFLHRGINCT